MKESGFYKIKQEYIDLIQKLNGVYRDNKERPIYCCMRDRDNPNIYWAIPTSDISHKSAKTFDRIKFLCALPERDIRSCYYHIGTTNRPAVFKISNVLPLTDTYIDGEYTSKGIHLILQDKIQIREIHRKLSRILFDEERHPNKYEQRITDVKNYIISELEHLE